MSLIAEGLRSRRTRVQIEASAVVGLLLLIYPVVVSDFFAYQIGGYSLILGTVALSLMVLAGYGGMVSLAQLTVAGVAGYCVALFGSNSAGLGLDWPWWIVVPLAIAIGAFAGALIGAISVRTTGIYTIMITLAIATSFFYLTRQNYSIFNGFDGFAGIEAPVAFGVDWGEAVPFYYLCLGVAGLFYFTVVYAARSTFGLALQAIRDNPRRMRAIGFNVTWHRIVAHLFAGVIAASGGVLLVWFNGRISPGSIGIDVAIDILVIAVVGGVVHPVGPFLGALLFVLLENFAIDLIDRERFNLVIGLAFLLVVFVSPNGIVGLWQKARPHFAAPSFNLAGRWRPR
ncbi:MAG: branched-chain amino acid ABC transporter permease [Alphaproteobacteria bacterium]